MKLTKTFWITFALMGALFILPSILTKNAPDVDSQRVYGFPLYFAAAGGGVASSFGFFELLIDIVILIAVPLGLNFVALRKRGMVLYASFAGVAICLLLIALFLPRVL